MKERNRELCCNKDYGYNSCILRTDNDNYNLFY